jgi:hypothetical protein
MGKKVISSADQLLNAHQLMLRGNSSSTANHGHRHYFALIRIQRVTRMQQCLT